MMDHNVRIINRTNVLTNQIDRFLLAFITFSIGWMFGYKLRLEGDNVVVRAMCRLLGPIGSTNNIIPLIFATDCLFWGYYFPLYLSEKLELFIKRSAAALKNKAYEMKIKIISFAKTFVYGVKAIWLAVTSVGLGWIIGYALMVSYGSDIADAVNKLFSTTIFVPDMLPLFCAAIVAFWNCHDI